MTPKKIAELLRRLVDRQGKYVEGEGTVVRANLILGLASEVEGEARLEAEQAPKVPTGWASQS